MEKVPTHFQTFQEYFKRRMANQRTQDGLGKTPRPSQSHSWLQSQAQLTVTEPAEQTVGLSVVPSVHSSTLIIHYSLLTAGTAGGPLQWEFSVHQQLLQIPPKCS